MCVKNENQKWGEYKKKGGEGDEEVFLLNTQGF